MLSPDVEYPRIMLKKTCGINATQRVKLNAT